jgi:hypothetical protein
MYAPRMRSNSSRDASHSRWIAILDPLEFLLPWALYEDIKSVLTFLQDALGSATHNHALPPIWQPHELRLRRVRPVSPDRRRREQDRTRDKPLPPFENPIVGFVAAAVPVPARVVPEFRCPRLSERIRLLLLVLVVVPRSSPLVRRVGTVWRVGSRVGTRLGVSVRRLRNH